MTGRKGRALQTVKHCEHMSESLFRRLEDLSVENVPCLLLTESEVTDLSAP